MNAEQAKANNISNKDEWIAVSILAKQMNMNTSTVKKIAKKQLTKEKDFVVISTFSAANYTVMHIRIKCIPTILKYRKKAK